MATTALEEEKRKAAIAAQAGTVIPNAAPLQSQGMAVLKASTPAAAPEKPAPSLNAPWYSREYATAANMSDKSGVDLERMRAAGATGIPQDDPMRRLAAVGTLSTGAEPATPAQTSPAAKPVPSGTSLVTASQSQRGEGSIPGTPAPTAPAAPATGAITKRIGADGVTEYSGMNVGLNPEFLNGSGQSFKPQGGGYVFVNAASEADKAKAAAMGGRLDQYGNVITAQVDKALTKPDGTRWNANDMAALAASQQQPDSRMAMMGSGTNTGGFGILDANYQRERALRMDAADSRNPGESRRAYEARIAGATGALNTFRGEQTAAPRLAAAQRSADAKTQADIALASRKMAFDEAQGGARMGLDILRQTDEAKTNAMRRDATGMEIEKAKALDAARQEYLAAGDDPAKQKAAAKKLAVLNGKSKDDEWGVQVTPATKNLDGTTTPGSVYKYNKATGEVVPVQGMDAGGQQAQAGAKPSSDGLVAGQAYPRKLNGVTANYEYLGNGQWSATPLKN